MNVSGLGIYMVSTHENEEEPEYLHVKIKS